MTESHFFKPKKYHLHTSFDKVYKKKGTHYIKYPADNEENWGLVIAKTDQETSDVLDDDFLKPLWVKYWTEGEGAEENREKFGFSKDEQGVVFIGMFQKEGVEPTPFFYAGNMIRPIKKDEEQVKKIKNTKGYVVDYSVWELGNMNETAAQKYTRYVVNQEPFKLAENKQEVAWKFVSDKPVTKGGKRRKSRKSKRRKRKTKRKKRRKSRKLKKTKRRRRRRRR